MDDKLNLSLDLYDNLIYLLKQKSMETKIILMKI